MAAALRFSNPKTLYDPPGYSHVVEAIGPGRIVYIAGQLGMDVGGKLVGQAGDFRAQAAQTFENLKHALAEVGATFSDVVKINTYLTDLAHLPILREVRNGYINMAAPPASTTIQITALARDGALLEIEAIALLPAAPSRAAATSSRRKRSAAKTGAKKGGSKAGTKKRPRKAKARRR